jgi:D-sedoheptulose 7-phosphate isomerase
VLAFTGPRPNPLADIADQALSVDSPFTATVQELHLVALHVLCASMDRALGVTAVARGALEDVPELHSAASTAVLT